MVDEADLIGFLLQAKRQTYAGKDDTASVAPALPGTRQLEYRLGPYLYRDIFAGAQFFVGQEIVYHEDKPVWSMSYAGGVDAYLDDQAQVDEIYAFLRLALRQGTPGLPFRGPAKFRQRSFLYTNKAQGDLDAFTGRELISLANAKVYELYYMGGLLR